MRGFIHPRAKTCGPLRSSLRRKSGGMKRKKDDAHDHTQFYRASETAWLG